MMKEWQKKMVQGMRLMQEACAENGAWNECKNCPFGHFCTALMDAALIDPFEGLQDKEWLLD